MNDIRKIVVCGNGYAAYQTALALTESLSSDIEVSILLTQCQESTDILYGNIAAPSLYDFNLLLNVSEPDILFNTKTGFSYGTYFKQWGMCEHSWMQCFHLQFPVEKGVGFHHFVTRQANGELEKYLISAQAAIQGKFAHPPSADSKHPLSRAEYGYQFSPQEWSLLYASQIEKSSVNVIAGQIETVEIENGNITCVTLKSGEEIEATLFVDCTGPEAKLLTALGIKQEITRQLGFVKGHKSAEQLGDAYGTLTSHDFGWQLDVPLRDRTERLTAFHPSMKTAALKAHEFSIEQEIKVNIGRRELAWVGNCVAIGQSANVIEPLTSAPTMMLCRDIQRLLELLPISSDMEDEATEYNRRFKEDVCHVELFHGALFDINDLPEQPFWKEASVVNAPEKLRRKISQFEHRGVLASFDLEPFNEQDWTVLHFGMGRMPRIYDCLGDQIPVADMSLKLQTLQNIINQVVAKMPPHALYMKNLLQYLTKNDEKR